MEYFEAWKNSRFIAGEDATELGFVAASRLSDIADILEELVLTYDQVEPLIAAENPQQAAQTRKELADLLAYVEDLRNQEAGARNSPPRKPTRSAPRRSVRPRRSPAR